MQEKQRQTSNQDIVLSLIRELSGQQNTLIIPRIFIRMTGSVNSALLLSQIIYWSDKSTNKSLRANLVFAKTEPEFEEELGLGHKAFENAREKLELLGLIRTRSGGFAGKKALFWHPEMEKITEQIRMAASVQKSGEQSTGDYKAFLTDFLRDGESAILPNQDVGNEPNGSMVSIQSASGKLPESATRIAGNDGLGLPETADSNTDITPQNKSYTTTRQDSQPVVGGFISKSQTNSQWNLEAFTGDWNDFVQSLSPEIKPVEFQGLAESFLSAFSEFPEITKQQTRLILAFSVLTGFKDFKRTDKKNGQIRTTLDRWIEPVRDWAKRDVSVDDIQVAIQGAKKDGIHSRLICPASYSPRVLNAHQSASVNTSQFDDEV